MEKTERNRLRNRIYTLSTALEKSEREEWERGKELEKIMSTVNSCKSLIAEQVYKKLATIFEGYSKRCLKNGDKK